MVVLVSGATKDVMQAPPSIGVLIQPFQGNDPASLQLDRRTWAVDNAGVDAVVDRWEVTEANEDEYQRFEAKRARMAQWLANTASGQANRRGDL